MLAMIPGVIGTLRPTPAWKFSNSIENKIHCAICF